VSTQRLSPIPHSPGRGPNGRRLCRGCGVEVPQGRRTWCSEACVEAALIRAGRTWAITAAVLRRDKGVCAICGADAEKVERIIESLWRERGPWGSREYQDYEASARLIREAWGRSCYSGITQLWEADHIVPVCEGGGGCGLDGYRTLCRPCHKAETAKLRKRIGKGRR
jgi:5-methylcytosine-specific restriction protein A